MNNIRSIGIASASAQKSDDLLKVYFHLVDQNKKSKLKKFMAINGRGLFDAALNLLNQYMRNFPNGELDVYLSNLQKLEPCLHKVAEYHNFLGVIFIKRDQVEQAIVSLKKALNLKPNQDSALSNLGLALRKQNALKEANAVLQKAVNLNSKNWQAWNVLGLNLKDANELDLAVKCFHQALAVMPSAYEVANNLGSAYHEQQKYDLAEEYYIKAVDLNPRYEQVFFNLSCLAKDRGEINQAIKYLAKAEEFNPLNLEYKLSRAVFDFDNLNFDQGMEKIDRLLDCPDIQAKARYQKSLALLRNHEFDQAWPLYDERWHVPDTKLKRLDTNLPSWTGQAIGHLLIEAEQGIGDVILFASALKDAMPLAKHITVMVDPRLCSLLQRSFGDAISVRSQDDHIDFSNVDAACPIGDLFKFFRRDEDAFQSGRKAYLKTQSHQVQDLRNRILDGSGFHKVIGLSWKSSNPRTGVIKSCNLSQIIATLPQDYALVNLQYGDVSADLAQIKAEYNVSVLDLVDLDITNDLDQFAHVIAACDLVVTTANSTAHFSGALAKQTHVILPYAAEWRWGKEDDFSIIYDNMILHRQKTNQDWETPLTQLKSALEHDHE